MRLPIIGAPPLSYLRTIGLMREAKFVITDSGGVQKETTASGVPWLTVKYRAADHDRAENQPARWNFV